MHVHTARGGKGSQPAASVRHRYSGIWVQSGTAGHGLVRHCPALLKIKKLRSNPRVTRIKPENSSRNV